MWNKDYCLWLEENERIEVVQYRVAATADAKSPYPPYYYCPGIFILIVMAAIPSFPLVCKLFLSDFLLSPDEDFFEFLHK